MDEPRESEWTAGATIGDYEVLGVAGKGGMGRVYRVRNRISGRVEAMKVILPDLEAEPELAQRFIAEIRTLGSLHHPNIAELHTAMTDGNRLVMLMEYVDGVSLSERLRSSPPSLEQSLDYCLQALKALEYAHERNIVHRDVKPANMMVTPAGVVKLLDFGIAKSAHSQLETAPGMPLGSVRYASPEQLRGDPIDARSDIYSLGVTLYELVTHRLPFEAENSVALLAKQLNEEPPPPRQFSTAVPESLNEIILMAMEKSPDRRFKSATALSRALESVARSLTPSVADAMANTIPASPPAADTMSGPARQRGNRSFWMAYGAIASLVVIGAAAFLVPRYVKTSANSATPVSEAAPLTAKNSPRPAQQAEPAPVESEKEKDNAVSRMVSSGKDAGSSPSKRRPVATISKTIVIPPASPGQSQGVQPAPPPAPPEPNAGGISAGTYQEAGPSANQAGGLLGKQLDERFDQLAARAEAARESVERIRAQQDAMGLGLRSDISVALRQMQTSLSRGEHELQNQNWSAVRPALDKAEQSLEKLEKFLGK